MPDRLSIEIAWLFALTVTDMATKGQKSPGQAATIAGMRVIVRRDGPMPATARLYDQQAAGRARTSEFRGRQRTTRCLLGSPETLERDDACWPQSSAPGRHKLSEMAPVPDLGPRRSACTISHFTAIIRLCREVSVRPRLVGVSSPVGRESANSDRAEVAVVDSDDE